MISADGDRLVVAADMTIPNAQALLASGCALVAAGAAEIDLSAVGALDSSALAVLFGWQRTAQSAGRSLRLSAAPDALRVLAELYGVADLPPVSALPA